MWYDIETVIMGNNESAVAATALGSTSGSPASGGPEPSPSPPTSIKEEEASITSLEGFQYHSQPSPSASSNCSSASPVRNTQDADFYQGYYAHAAAAAHAAQQSSNQYYYNQYHNHHQQQYHHPGQEQLNLNVNVNVNVLPNKYEVPQICR